MGCGVSFASTACFLFLLTVVGGSESELESESESLEDETFLFGNLLAGTGLAGVLAPALGVATFGVAACCFGVAVEAAEARVVVDDLADD